MFADRVKETTASTGTGTVNLAGAATGFRTFVAGIGTGKLAAYTITDGTNWECGVGTVTSGSPDTLTRTTILASSNGGSAVNFGAGTKTVFNDLPSAYVFERVQAKSGAYTAVMSDINTVIRCTASLTLSLTAAATLGNGWFCDVRNDATTGFVTIDPNSSETIDGSTTIILAPGEACRLVCNGTSFYTIGRQRGWILLQRQTASGASTVDFTAGITSDFDEYAFLVDEWVPSTTATLQMRVSEDAGSNWKSGATDYGHTRFGNVDGGGFSSGGAVSATQIDLVSQSAAAGDSAALDIRMFKPAGTKHKLFSWINPAGQASISMIIGGARYKGSTNAINGVRFMSSTGTFSGTFSLYGIRK